MINVQAVADYLASTTASTPEADNTNLITSLLTIANQLAAQQRMGIVAGHGDLQQLQSLQESLEMQAAHMGQTPAQLQAAVAAAAHVQQQAVQQAAAGMAAVRSVIPQLQPLVAPQAHVRPLVAPQRTVEGIAAQLQQTIQEQGEPTREELAEPIKAFVARYPVDTRAYEYFVTSPPAVVAHIIREFKPPREGEPDYSSLITTYVKRVRSAYQGPGEQRIGPPPRAEGPRGGAVNAEMIGPKLRDSVGGDEIAQALQQFVARYPMDEKACNLMMGADPAVQVRVLQEFRPHREGDADYSALVTTFTKKIADQVGVPLVYPPPKGPESFTDARGQESAVFATLPPDGAPRELQVAKMTPGLDAFLTRYPIDERAYDYFAQCPVEVQQKVLMNFRPMREGEAQYSGLFTSFVKKCRTDFGVTGGAPPPDGFRHAQPRHAGAIADAGAGGGHHWGAGGSGEGLGSFAHNSFEEQQFQQLLNATSGSGSGPVDLEGFRVRFPMDERAFDFLSTAAKEVQERVVETFVPQRLDDSDFSAPVTAYVRSLRNQVLTEASSATHAGPAVVNDEEALTRFLERYPCDARAADFLQSSAPEVRGQVLREFRPRAEGESDYSAAVTSFVKKMRNMAMEGSWRNQGPMHSGGGGFPGPRPRPPLFVPPSKRPRVTYS